MCRAGDLGHLGAYPDAMDDASRSTCYRCGVSKGLDAFITRVDDRRYSMCRSCVSEILARRVRRHA